MRAKRTILGSILVVSLLAACGDDGNDGEEVRLTSVVVTPTPITLVKGLDGQLAATGVHSDGTTEDLTALVIWSSSDEEVATVSGGVIATMGAGPATITARHEASGLEGSASLTVTRAEAITVSVTPAEVTFDYLDVSPVFAASGLLTDGHSGDLTALLTWSVEDPTIATVTDGVVTPRKRGTTSIVATEPSTGATDHATLVVTRAAKYVGMSGLVECHPNFCTVPYAWDYDCGVILDDDSYIEQPAASLVWSTNNPSVATVNGQGRATFTAYGTVEIIATFTNGLECRITTTLHPD